MKQSSLTLFFGSILVIIFDTLASLASLHFQIDYASFILGSTFIYIYCGFYCAKYGNVLWAVLGAGFIGLVDSTIGWYISWHIGPGRPEVEMNSTEIFEAIIYVTITALPFGLVGALFNRLLHRSSS